MSKLPSLRTPDGPVKTLSEWREFARRDDCLARMVPSDMRTLNAEMREALKQIAAETHGAVDDPDASRINRIASAALAKAEGESNA